MYGHAFGMCRDRRYIFEARRDGFLGLGGQLCEVHITVFIFHTVHRLFLFRLLERLSQQML